MVTRRGPRVGVAEWVWLEVGVVGWRLWECGGPTQMVLSGGCPGRARGNRSPEGDHIGTARQQLKRAIGLGCTSMADRYENDVQFVERMTEHNITLLDIQLRDIVSRPSSHASTHSCSG